jgi:DNA-binding CsgD family transcriptional regulator
MLSVALVVALGTLGRVDEASELALAGSDSTVAAGNGNVQGWFALVHARALLEAGRVASADRWFREAQAVFATLGRAGDPHLRWAVAGRVIAAALRGDRAATLALVAELDGIRASTATLFEPDVLRARGWAAWLTGDTRAATGCFTAAAALAHHRAAASQAAAALHDAVRLGLADAATAAPALARLAGDDPGLPALRASHAAALAAGDPGALLDVAERAGASGLVLLGAEAAAAAAGHLRRDADRSGAEAAGRRARALADRCEGARPVGIEHAGEGALLTGREREVAELAATGLSSRQIAERLRVSPRTVDNLLSRAYQKLGITSRADLPAALA